MAYGNPAAPSHSDAPPAPARAKSRFRFHSHFKDTIAVQKRRNYVNDDEEHEEDGHLRDLLRLHRMGSVDPIDTPLLLPGAGGSGERPALPRPCRSIMHDAESPGRRSCEVTESKRRISFRDVTVRDYDMVLGDHPNCSWGPPVALGWSYLEYEPLDLNEYEYHHSRRRPLKKLVLSSNYRTEMLRPEHSNEEIRLAVKEKDRAMLRRSVTRKLLPLSGVEDALESAGRKVKRAALGKGPPKRTWAPEDELDWSVRGGHRSILRAEKAGAQRHAAALRGRSGSSDEHTQSVSTLEGT